MKAKVLKKIRYLRKERLPGDTIDLDEETFRRLAHYGYVEAEEVNEGEIMAAMIKIMERNAEGDLTGKGAPTVEAIDKECGYKITAKERDRLFKKLTEEPEKGPEGPPEDKAKTEAPATK